eukprot:364054-Chlamydomonas_euryale.AAC.2
MEPRSRSLRGRGSAPAPVFLRIAPHGRAAHPSANAHKRRRARVRMGARPVARSRAQQPPPPHFPPPHVRIARKGHARAHTQRRDRDGGRRAALTPVMPRPHFSSASNVAGAYSSIQALHVCIGGGRFGSKPGAVCARRKGGATKSVQRTECERDRAAAATGNSSARWKHAVAGGKGWGGGERGGEEEGKGGEGGGEGGRKGEGGGGC